MLTTRVTETYLTMHCSNDASEIRGTGVTVICMGQLVVMWVITNS